MRWSGSRRLVNKNHVDAVEEYGRINGCRSIRYVSLWWRVSARSGSGGRTGEIHLHDKLRKVRQADRKSAHPPKGSTRMQEFI